jgi:Rha family phage regulatory protein
MTTEDSKPRLLSPKKMVFVKDGKVVTNTLKVADAFGLQHSNVFCSAENLDCVVSEASYQHNFSQNISLDSSQNEQSVIDMTMCGFIFLTPHLFDTFTRQVTESIETYINEFNFVEEQLRQFKVTASQYELLRQFWSVVKSLNVNNRLNHSNNPKVELALNIQQLYNRCYKEKLTIPDFKKVKPLLLYDSYHPFIANKPVLSRISKSTIRCWIFKIN